MWPSFHQFFLAGEPTIDLIVGNMVISNYITGDKSNKNNTGLYDQTINLIGSTEVAYLLLSQQTQVLFPAFPKFFQRKNYQ